MIQRLPDAQRQQKKGNHLEKENMKTRTKRSTKNRSILTKSLLRSPDVSIAAPVASEIDEDSLCLISPPAKFKKKHDVPRDNMVCFFIL